LYERIQQDGCAGLYAVDVIGTDTMHELHTESAVALFADSLVDISEMLDKLEINFTTETLMLLLLGKRNLLSAHLLYDHPEINSHWQTVGESFLPGQLRDVIGQEHFEMWRDNKDSLVAVDGYQWWQQVACTGQNMFAKYTGGIAA